MSPRTTDVRMVDMDPLFLELGGLNRGIVHMVEGVGVQGVDAVPLVIVQTRLSPGG